MLTEQTTNAVLLCIEFLKFTCKEDFMNALQELQTLITTNLQGNCEIKILDRNHPEEIIEN